MVSSNFGEMVEDHVELSEAVAWHIDRAAEDLREQGAVAVRCAWGTDLTFRPLVRDGDIVAASLTSSAQLPGKQPNVVRIFGERYVEETFSRTLGNPGRPIPGPRPISGVLSCSWHAALPHR